jgi:hypothetical protein
VNEEEASVEKCCRSGFSAITVSLSHVGLEDAIEDVKEAEAQTITGVRVEVADLVIGILAEWRRSNANEEDGHRAAGIRHLADAEGMLDTGRPAVKALMARCDALFALHPAL